MSGVGERVGEADDEHALLGLFDEAVAWMVARGQPGQWGSEPPSGDPRWRERIDGLVAENELHVLEAGDELLGVLALGQAPPYVEPAEGPELYVHLLITARSHKGERLGSRLLEIARRRAREQGVGLLRVDCWAGSRSLVGWYESEGFEPCGTFDNGGWPGQVLRRAVGR